MKTYVWSLPTRIFHWMLVFFVVLAFITSENEASLNIHASFGYGIGVLVVSRILWGFIGPEYSRFSDWPLSVREAIEFSKNILNPHREYLSHNPAASFVMLGIIITLLLLTITGMLTYGIQEGRGVLSFLNSAFYNDMDIFAEIHDALSALLLVLLASHILGIVMDMFLHPNLDTLGSIFKGYKNISGKSIVLSKVQKLFSIIMLVIAFLMPIYTLSFDTIFTKSKYVSIDYEAAQPLFANECAACHTLYPPTLLPKKSWRILMSDLENHFGDDASLEVEEEKSILKYLISNSAESSTSEASVNILKSFPNMDIITITKTKFWEKRHRDIDKSVFESEKVKSKANCKACHNDIERGTIEDKNIKIPKLRS